MGKNKLQRFSDVERFDNVFELTDYEDKDITKPKGEWRSGIFENNHPLILELACGKGEYTLGLAQRNPNSNYVGIDIKGSRIWKGAKRALSDNLTNVRFLRIYIDHLEEYFAPGEVDELWVTFPDPYLKISKRNKRLSSPKFLNIYRNVLKEEGVIHFKTDSDPLFNYTCRVIDKCNCEILDRVDHVYEERPGDRKLTLKTYYEKKHLDNGKKIKYLKFRLPREAISELKYNTI